MDPFVFVLFASIFICSGILLVISALLLLSYIRKRESYENM